MNRTARLLLTLWALTACAPPSSPSSPSDGSGGTGSGGTSPPPPVADAAPQFGVQPPDVSVTAPAAALFQGSVSGSPTPTFQWQRSADGATWNDVPGATSASYSLTPTSTTDSGSRFRLKAVNRAGTATSRTVNLTVAPAAAVAGWASPVRIGPALAVGTYDAQGSLDAAGNGIAVWQQDGGTAVRTLWWSRYTPAGGWTEAAQLVGDAALSAEHPVLGVRDDGSAVVAWQFLDSGNNGQVWMREFAPASGWSVSSRLDTWDPNELYPGADAPRLAVGGGGSYLVTWQQSVGYVVRTYTVTKPAGGSPTSPSELASGYGVGLGQAAVNASGTGWLPWTQSAAGSTDVKVTPLGGGDAVVLRTTDSTAATRPWAAVNSAGQAMVVWAEQVGTRFDQWSARFTPGTGWGPAQLMETDTTTPYAVIPVTRVLVGADGTATSLWGQSGGGFTRIYQNTQAAGQSWGTAQAKVYGTDQFAAALNPAGQPVVLYSSNGHMTATVGWTNQIVLYTGTGGPASVSFDGQGRGWALWTQPNGVGSGSTVYGSRFE